uniref:Uncharacterized protein n=2 Tax=Triticum urartu TaxID=4572 RepID=A0A8R7TLD4_TRIUA
MTKTLPMAMANIFICFVLLSSLIASPPESARIVHEHRAHVAAGEETRDRHLPDDLGEIKRAQPHQFAPPAPQANEQRYPPIWHDGSPSV